MRKVWAALCAFLCLVYGSAAYAAGTPKSVLDARASVVPIEIYQNSGQLVGAGSGFAIGAPGQPVEYIVTNDHVGGGAGEYCVVYTGDYRESGTSVLFTSPASDLCVLKLDQPMSGVPPLLLSPDAADALAGERVYALGFPVSADYMFSRGKTTAGDVTITDGLISAVRNAPYQEGGGNVTMLQINVALSGGNSGGPLLDENGWVVGVNAFGSVDDANMYGAISIQELFAELDAHGVAYQTGAYAQPFPWWTVALAAVIVGAALFILLKWRAKRRVRGDGAKAAPKRIPLLGYVERNGTLSLEMALYLLLPVFQRARENERAGRGNPGIHPGNIQVLAESGRAVLHDAQSGNPAGGFRAPEQYREDGLIGGWTHVYQLGALLYYVLAGKPLPDIITRYEDDAAVWEAIGSLGLNEAQETALKKSVDLKAANRYVDVQAMMKAFAIAELPPVAGCEERAAGAGAQASKAGEAQCNTGCAEKAEAGAQAAEFGEPQLAAQEDAEEQPAAKPRLPKRRFWGDLTKGKKRVAIVLAGAVVLLGGVGAFLGVSVANKSRAVALIDQYAFQESYDLLQSVPAFLYPDLPDWVALAEAGVLYDKGEYSAARAGFSALGGFGIAEDMAEKSAEREREQERARLLAEAEEYIAAGQKREANVVIRAYQYGASGSGRYVIPEKEAQEIDYGLAKIYYDYGYATDAIVILQKLGEKNYKDSKPLLRELVLSKAADYIQADKPLLAYEFMRQHQDDPEIKKVMEEMIPLIYNKGISYLNANDENQARRYFQEVENYGEAKTYLMLIETNNVFRLLPYIEEPYVQKKVHREGFLRNYLIGRWAGEGASLHADRKYGWIFTITYRIRGVEEGNASSIDSGTIEKFDIYHNYDKDRILYDMPGKQERLRFTIISRDVMEVYAYKNGRTYRMTRQ